jgi:hypothetical protein
VLAATRKLCSTKQEKQALATAKKNKNLLFWLWQVFFVLVVLTKNISLYNKWFKNSCGKAESTYCVRYSLRTRRESASLFGFLRIYSETHQWVSSGRMG